VNSAYPRVLLDCTPASNLSVETAQEQRNRSSPRAAAPVGFFVVNSGGRRQLPFSCVHQWLPAGDTSPCSSSIRKTGSGFWWCVFCSKLCKTGGNIFSISIFIRGLKNELFMVGVRKLTCCNGIRPCSEKVLALSALMEVRLEACVRVTVESTAANKATARVAELCLWEGSQALRDPE